jgi:hypothetical protein
MRELPWPRASAAGPDSTTRTDPGSRGVRSSVGGVAQAGDATRTAVEAGLGLLRRAAIVMTAVGVVLGSSTWAVVERWPPLRGAGSSVVAAFAIGLTPAGFLLVSYLRSRRLVDQLATIRSPRLEARSALGRVLGLRAAALQLSSASTLPTLMLTGTISALLVLALTPLVVLLAGWALLA